jgi:hypothetical protein
MRLAPLGRRRSCFDRATGSERLDRRTGGGDLEEENGRSRRMKRDLYHALVRGRGGLCGSSARGERAPQRDQVVGPGACTRAGRGDAGDAISDDGETPRKREIILRDGSRAQEDLERPAGDGQGEGGSGKGQRPATVLAERQLLQDLSERLDTWKPRPVSSSTRRATRA